MAKMILSMDNRGREGRHFVRHFSAIESGLGTAISPRQRFAKALRCLIIVERISEDVGRFGKERQSGLKV